MDSNARFRGSEPTDTFPNSEFSDTENHVPLDLETLTSAYAIQLAEDAND